VAPVTGDDLDSKLKETQQAFAYFETKDFDGVVEMGDTVIIDYQGLKDGVAFEGGTAQGHNLEIGSHSFIPGFEEGLLGMKIEESKDLPLTFPENYHAEELAGADVIFKVTIQGIKAKKLPDIDDDLALDTSIKGVENLEDLKAHLEREIIRERTELAEEDFTTRIMDQLIALNPVELPEGMIQTQIQTMVQQYMTQLQQQGVSLSQVLKYNGMDHKAFLDSVREPAINNLKSGLILRAIIKAENLIATEEEIDEALTEMAQAYNMTLEQFKTAASSNLENIKANLSQQAAYNKAIQFVKDHTVSSN
ncbi:MAG: trigger factor, partial [bacterium]